MAVKNAAQQRHADWIGMAQPEGLVVSVPVLDELDLYVKQPREVVLALRDAAPEGEIDGIETLAELLGWTDRELVPAPADL